jgi:hypothetical protein
MESFAMSDRTERREEIRIKLEYVKMLLSFIGFSGIILASLQWMIGNQVASHNIYQSMTTEWRDHLKVFVEKPQLRPYFEEAKPLESSDQFRSAVLAVADVRLDVMDAILTYADFRFSQAYIGGWRNTFSYAFRTSPTLCERFFETSENYGFIIPIAREACDRWRLPQQR